MEVQKLMAVKQKQDLEEKMKKILEEQAKKQREEEEEKKRKAAAEEKKKKDMAENQRNLLAYQKLMDAKKVEEESKKAQKAEILKMAMEKLNRIINNPLLLPEVKKQMDERKSILINALKASVEKGESLVTLIATLDNFDKTLKKAPAPPSSTPSVKTSTPSTSISSNSVQQNQRNGSNVSIPLQKRQQTQPVNLSTLTAPASVASKPHAPAVKEKVQPPPVTSVSRNIQRPQASPQSRNNASTLQTPSATVSQKSPQPSASTPTKTSTPSKASVAAAAALDTSKTREQVVADIEKMVQQFAPNDMKEFVRMKPSLLQKSKTELDQIHSTMFVTYICGKAAATSLNIPSASSNTNILTGKRSAPQVSPSPAQNIAAKVRRTENNSTAAVLPPSSSSSSNVHRPQTISQSKSATTLQTSSSKAPQMPPQLSSI
uniref:Uncharacterized protein n=1 Tax=Panagrolaimus davidi TaxID=227884 RepID=A0A914PED7_9BILA